MNRTELRLLAEERLADAELLLVNRRYGAAYYMVGYAVECGLKACIARLTRDEDFYDKELARNIFNHDLGRLSNYARLKVVIDQLGTADPTFAANWAQVSAWSEESRYGSHTRQEAEQLVMAVAEPVHGVLQCIKQYW